MEHLIMVRHGEYTPGSGALDDIGREQAKAIAQKIERLNLGTPYIITSHKLRAQQTAQIIGAQFGVDPQIDERLYTDNRIYPSDSLMDDILNDLQARSEPLVIVVSHYELVELFPAHVMRSLGEPLPTEPMERGGAAYIDLDETIYTRL